MLSVGFAAIGEISYNLPALFLVISRSGRGLYVAVLPVLEPSISATS